ncbi:uncharacterized protein LOC128724930 [Anopheles nili]|uniref:uncharacterized protein LOC128724930 n=1 Tax=Anopheles nili TaxID=185578 RepID=UPI00237A605F|nr:uncharacterized protein LOC128724930 [Anopheles nili]
MKKIRNGISIGSMTKVNLLTKLKNQVDIAYSTEIIKSLKYLPKSWTNEAIEIRALEQAKKERQKYKPVKPGDIPVAVSSNTSTNIDAAGESNSCKKIVKEGYEPGSDTVADGFDSETASGTNEVTTIETNGKKLKKMKQRKRKLSDDLANLSNARNDSTIEDHGIEPKVKRIQKKTLASTCDGSDLKKVSVKEKKQRWRKLKQVLDNKAVV